LSEDLLKEWHEIVMDLQQKSTLKISRFVGGAHGGQSQLLIFCDASTKAYAIVVYLRIKDRLMYQTNILFSKLCLVPA